MIREITGKITNEIKERKINSEFAVIEVIDRFSEKLKNLNDDYLRERVHDLTTIKNRFLAILMQKTVSDWHQFSDMNSSRKETYILVSDEIMPSDFAVIKKGFISGIIHGKGGKTSHIAIIARSMEIPTIVGAEKILNHINDRDIVILDAYDGTIYINPDITTLREYKTKKEEKERHYLDLIQKTKSQPAITLDQIRISIMANVEVDSDIEKLQLYGAEGIGLYRTEFLFLEDEDSKVNSSIFMDEERQFIVYKKLAMTANPKPVVIRTLDIGRNHIKDEKHENNPFLGLRSIRYCLMNLGMFKTQIRAILRASHYGYVKMMIPMITNIEELHTVRTLVDEVKKELKVEGIYFDEDIEIGVMIEVPASALIIDLISKMVDFVTIGTNDLLQYTLAVDRSSPDLNYLYNPFSISFLRLLRYIVKNIKKTPFYICGEITSDPLFVIFVIGLGVTGLSMNIYDIPKIKNLVSHISYEEVKAIANQVLHFDHDGEIIDYLHQFYNDKFLDRG
jgi:phosphotransferase system enzyme I (PtsI)